MRINHETLGGTFWTLLQHLAHCVFEHAFAVRVRVCLYHQASLYPSARRAEASESERSTQGGKEWREKKKTDGVSV